MRDIIIFIVFRWFSRISVVVVVGGYVVNSVGAAVCSYCCDLVVDDSDVVVGVVGRVDVGGVFSTVVEHNEIVVVAVAVDVDPVDAGDSGAIDIGGVVVSCCRVRHRCGFGCLSASLFSSLALWL